MKVIKRRTLSYIPFDREFCGEMCHSTGEEVLFEGDAVWWCEFVDSEGNLYYGN